MKTMTLTVLLALSGSLLTTTRVEAAACPKELLRHVQSLDSLTDRLLSEYRNELRTHSKGGRPCREQAALLDTFYSMESQADSLRSAVENREPPCTQEQIFLTLKQTHCRADSLARQVGVCGCVKGLLAQTGSTLASLERMGFHVATPPPPRYDSHSGYYGRGHGSGRDEGRNLPSRPPHPRDIILGGLLGLLSGR